MTIFPHTILTPVCSVLTAEGPNDEILDWFKLQLKTPGARGKLESTLKFGVLQAMIFLYNEDVKLPDEMMP